MQTTQVAWQEARQGVKQEVWQATRQEAWQETGRPPSCRPAQRLRPAPKDRSSKTAPQGQFSSLGTVPWGQRSQGQSPCPGRQAASQGARAGFLSQDSGHGLCVRAACQTRAPQHAPRALRKLASSGRSRPPGRLSGVRQGTNQDARRPAKTAGRTAHPAPRRSARPRQARPAYETSSSFATAAPSLRHSRKAEGCRGLACRDLESVLKLNTLGQPLFDCHSLKQDV